MKDDLFYYGILGIDLLLGVFLIELPCFNFKADLGADVRTIWYFYLFYGVFAVVDGYAWPSLKIGGLLPWYTTFDFLFLSISPFLPALD